MYIVIIVIINSATKCHSNKKLSQTQLSAAANFFYSFYFKGNASTTSFSYHLFNPF